MLSKDVEIAIRVALNDAQRRQHEYATVEHLTFALLHDDETANVLKHCGADVAALKVAFEKFLDEDRVASMCLLKTTRRWQQKALSKHYAPVHCLK